METATAVEIKEGDNVTFQPSKKADRGEQPMSGVVLKVFTNKDGDTYANIKGATKNYMKRIEKVTKA